MITQFEIDGSAISDALADVLDSLVVALLQILSGFFELIFDWVIELIAGTFFDSPAVLLVGLILMITAYKVSTSGG